MIHLNGLTSGDNDNCNNERNGLKDLCWLFGPFAILFIIAGCYVVWELRQPYTKKEEIVTEMMEIIRHTAEQAYFMGQYDAVTGSVKIEVKDGKWQWTDDMNDVSEEFDPSMLSLENYPLSGKRKEESHDNSIDDIMEFKDNGEVL